jgi:hypothetical protein
MIAVAKQSPTVQPVPVASEFSQGYTHNTEQSSGHEAGAGSSACAPASIPRNPNDATQIRVMRECNAVTHEETANHLRQILAAQ